MKILWPVYGLACASVALQGGFAIFVLLLIIFLSQPCCRTNARPLRAQRPPDRGKMAA
jgi:hypothetical protein